MAHRMRKVRFGGFALLAVAGILSASLLNAAPAEQTKADEADAAAIIFERQQLMTRLEENTETLGMIAAGTESPARLTQVTRDIARDAKDMAVAFEPRVVGGRSKPEVWTNWTDYSNRMKIFAEKSEEMARIAESGNISRVMEFMVVALPCKECHDTYRQPKRVE